jgi:hypothetical protein
MWGRHDEVISVHCIAGIEIMMAASGNHEPFFDFFEFLNVVLLDLA